MATVHWTLATHYIYFQCLTSYKDYYSHLELNELRLQQFSQIWLCVVQLIHGRLQSNLDLGFFVQEFKLLTLY